jgi:hypothetical protein
LALSKNELHFTELVNETASALNSSDAFAAIDDVVLLMQEGNEAIIQYYCGSLIIALFRQAETTELPKQLDRNWDSVTLQLADFPDIAGQMESWYRKTPEK